ncbi:MAG: RES domain-containing protein [Gammaproteobacteria bacterium]|nr:MAG: RES domain-containing protein [Gammaproteobacteria bacterium]
MSQPPKLIQLNNQTQYRIIPSKFPPINFFEGIVEPSEMETLLEIESLTNERIRQEVGDLSLIPVEDRISGPGSSAIMAAFTHIYNPSRFTDGSYGIYYAGLALETAIRETVFHRENFLKATNEDPGNITMRVYEGKIAKPLHDIRNPIFNKLHHPDSYVDSQNFGKTLREAKSWGLIYNSVRHVGGNCIAAFRPHAVSIPQQTAHLIYQWDGEKISTILNTTVVMRFD